MDKLTKFIDGKDPCCTNDTVPEIRRKIEINKYDLCEKRIRIDFEKTERIDTDVYIDAKPALSNAGGSRALEFIR